MRYGRGYPKEGIPKHHLTAPLGDTRAPAYRLGMYATRPMHDADSHIMEPADWLLPYVHQYYDDLSVLGKKD